MSAPRSSSMIGQRTPWCLMVKCASRPAILFPDESHLMISTCVGVEWMRPREDGVWNPFSLNFPEGVKNGAKSRGNGIQVQAP